jgi:hypothetical protein
MKNNKEQKPLTLEALASYNQDVLFPWMQENFVTKNEFKSLKGEVNGFKDESLTNQDKMLKKLDTLISESNSGKRQEERQKKFWAIVVKALQEHRILSPEDLQKISQLEIF